MGSERRFALGLAGHVVLLVAAALAFAAAIVTPGLAAARLIASGLVAAATWLLWRHVTGSSRDLARFVEALRHGDLAQGFARGDALGQALDGAIRALRQERAQAAGESRIQAALADEAPAALLTIDRDGRVTLANKAARKLFNRLPGTRVADFAGYGREFVALLGEEQPALRRLMPLRVDGVVQRATVTRVELRDVSRPLAVVSVQPIQAELSSVELAAQADLVRVLTHEIMNSMTPVVSLAGSAAALMARIDTGGDTDIADARAAIDTLARRSSGIMHFVETYRAFSRVPAIDPRRFAAQPWTDEIARLFAASEWGMKVRLDIDVQPADLSLHADPDLLAQVVINLLKNGAEAALQHGDDARVMLAAALLPGGRTRLTVRDNGPGIPPELAEEIFLPFFTTKAEGTGVGLSLARRIMVAHGGTIALGPATTGACFELTL